jgi:hypothetical protein
VSINRWRLFDEMERKLLDVTLSVSKFENRRVAMELLLFHSARPHKLRGFYVERQQKTLALGRPTNLKARLLVHLPMSNLTLLRAIARISAPAARYQFCDGSGAARGIVAAGQWSLAQQTRRKLAQLAVNTISCLLRLLRRLQSFSK